MKRLLLILLVLSAWVVPVHGAERILSYHSFITVHPDGDMTVTETITVISEGKQIKHGIYRDFPTRYKDRYNNAVTVDFKVQAVLQDGRPVHWWTEDRDNGVRVYIGDKNITLKPGQYSYELTYHTDRQLGFFKTHDELYWNVTGNGWAFPLDKVTATVELPAGAKVLSTEGYTGVYGSKGSDYTAHHDNSGRAEFRTTRPLKPYEGLTIVVTWPKGFVQEPSGADKARTFFLDNRSTTAGTAGIIILLIYYLLAWLRIGKDPEQGVIIPLYEAPKGFSPAAVRYVIHMGFDHRAFAAAIVDIAIKGFITIKQDTKGNYTLTRKGGNSQVLSRGESQVVRQLFLGGDTLAIKTSNHAAIRKAIKSLEKSLAVDYEKIYFLTNKGALIPGWVLSIITIAMIVILSRSIPIAGFMSVWLSGWTAGCAALVYSAFTAWRAVITGHSKRISALSSALFSTLFSLPFLAGECFGLWMFSKATSLPAVLTLFIVLLLNILFYHLMKAPTIKGRKIMDQIEGLRLYLSVAEKDRLEELQPAERPLDVFEKFLPYALALDVEQKWCEKFSRILSQAAQESGYTPIWYTGVHLGASGVAGLASSLSDMSSSISSASSPPGSSSGSGGGGSSGGGGGGGGGGGW